MAENATESEIAELEKLKEEFMESTGGSKTMTFRQCLTFPEIASWISEGKTTRDAVEGHWKHFATGLQGIDLEVGTRFNLNIWREILLPFSPVA